MKTVNVNLGHRSYSIHIGRHVLKNAGHSFQRLGIKKALIVTDDTVGKLYADQLTGILAKAHIQSNIISVKPGECSKSWAVLQDVCNGLLAQKTERSHAVVALGGGIIGDLAGFAASITLRGTRFIQIPTSLLAQVDSSVGGKTGINTEHGKNLIGAFYQPDLVLADTGLLDSLDPREIRAGYAEIAKYGLINDADFFTWCEQNWQNVLTGGSERDEAVAYCCKAKAAIVSRDEREQGERALLNLGHTFGHALERVVSYDSARLVHGEGVAIGLSLAFQFSHMLGLTSENQTLRVVEHLKHAGLPTRLQDVPGGCGTVDELLEAMAQDKKVANGHLTFILARGIGQSFVAKGIEQSSVRMFLQKKLETL